MLSYDKLESGVMKFLDDSKLECFDAEELASELEPQAEGEDRETVLRRVCGILDSCGLVARKHSSDLYYILDHFFRGTEFLCKPREVEIAKGILIPAARFEPFHPAELYPDELEISAKHSREAFSLKEIRVNYGEISDLFLMLGPAGTMDMLIAESQENYAHYADNHLMPYAVPVSVPDLEVMGDFMEVFGFHSRYIVRTAWIEAYSYEYCDDADSAEMLNLILDSRTYDPGYLFWNYEGEISNMISNGKNQVVKFTERYASTAAETISTFIESMTKANTK